MRKEDLGKIREAPVTQIGNNDFSWKPKNPIRVELEPCVRFIVYNSIKPTTVFVPINKVDAKKEYWDNNNITYKQLDK